MSMFASITPAPLPKTRDAGRIAVFYAGILVLMAVAQLFTFEEFVLLVRSFDLPGGAQLVHLLTATLITAEVFALPFLLRMPLSTAFRFLSMAAGWFVALLWTYITVWIVGLDSGVENVGFLGAAIATMPGWWAIFMSLTFGILAAWASWGMWPFKVASKKHSTRHR